MTDLATYAQLSPIMAVPTGKEPDAQKAIFEKFLGLPDAERKLLVSEETADTISSWIASGLVPESHGTAIAKIIAYVVLGEVPASSVGQLLMKLDLTPEQSAHMSAAIIEFLQPILTQQALKKIPQMGATEMPPMTRPTENGPRVLSPQPAARNIIDLRKTRPTDA